MITFETAMSSCSEMFAEAYMNDPENRCSCGCWYHGGDCRFRPDEYDEDEALRCCPFTSAFTLQVHRWHFHASLVQLEVPKPVVVPSCGSYDDPFADE